MISNSLGAMPRGVYDGMRAYADSWAERGVRGWEEGWWEMAIAVGDKIAPLIGAGPGEISLHQNVTLTQAVIASCFDLRSPRNKVVMVELEFPSIQYFYHEQRRHGARVEVVPALDHVRIDLDKLLAAIDETTLLVPISQVLFRSSYIVDARAIIERAHRVGAHVILDTFQAAGTIPLEVRKLGADFVVGGALKWLCGGPGVAYLDVREDSFRSLTGTPHIPALYACQPGLDILDKVGIAAIREKSIRMTTRLIEGAKSRGWRVNTPENPADRAGTVSVECPHAYEVCRELLAREILVDYRPKAGGRISPHFYNREEECDFTLTQIEEILRTRAWEKHAAVVTHA